jgi:uncharacterized protein YjiS (DUF1127 family)
MSCGNTICISTSYDLAISKPFAGFERFWPSLLAWLTRTSGACDQHYQRRQLLGLDDRLLADIGLSRDRAVKEACKSGWIRVTMWRIYQ